MTELKSKKEEFRVPLNLHHFGREFHPLFPEMTRPECFGFFSINGEREFQDNADNISYLHLPPTLPLDLNAGIDKVIRKKKVSQYHDMHMLCRYIYNHQNEMLKPFTSGNIGARRLDADFVTLRGLLRLIMCSLYEKRNDFQMHAVRMNNNIYMLKVETEKQRKDHEQATTHQQNLCSWGFKFEQYLTASSPKEKPNTDDPVNEAEEFVGMFKTRFAGMNLLFGAEMDCIRNTTEVNLKDPKVLNSVEFVELKTSAFQTNFRQRRNFNQYKSAVWWSQSFLVGISSIYVGFRDDQGLMHEIKELNVGELTHHRPWNPNAMGIFLKEFLNQLKNIMDTIDDPYAVVQVDYTPSDRCMYYEVIKTDQVKEILPDWYRRLLSERQPKRMKMTT